MISYDFLGGQDVQTIIWLIWRSHDSGAECVGNLFCAQVNQVPACILWSSWCHPSQRQTTELAMACYKISESARFSGLLWFTIVAKHKNKTNLQNVSLLVVGHKSLKCKLIPLSRWGCFIWIAVANSVFLCKKSMLVHQMLRTDCSSGDIYHMELGRLGLKDGSSV